MSTAKILLIIEDTATGSYFSDVMIHLKHHPVWVRDMLDAAPLLEIEEFDAAFIAVDMPVGESLPIPWLRRRGLQGPVVVIDPHAAIGDRPIGTPPAASENSAALSPDYVIPRVLTPTDLRSLLSRALEAAGRAAPRFRWAPPASEVA